MGLRARAAECKQIGDYKLSGNCCGVGEREHGTRLQTTEENTQPARPVLVTNLGRCLLHSPASNLKATRATSEPTPDKHFTYTELIRAINSPLFREASEAQREEIYSKSPPS